MNIEKKFSSPIELTLEAEKANVIALTISLPLLVLLMIPFVIIHNDLLSVETLKPQFKFWASPPGAMIVLLVIFIGIILHELIHGLTFSVFAKRGFKSIKFGILKKTITPYCHCTEALTVNQYRLSTIMPAIILGFVPVIIATINGNIALLLFGVFFTLAAAGDFIIIFLLRHQSSKALVQDHPEKIGCYLFQ